MKGITPFLWFDNQAEEAMNFYTSVFPHSKVLNVTRYTKAGPLPEGTLMTATFSLNGQEFTALNGGPEDFHFSEAISFYVSCETQAEVDDLWQKLTHGGEPGPCGWLKDKYGLSWQIVPAELGEMLSSGDPARSQRVMEAVLKMGKLELDTLRKAYEAA